MSRSHRTAGSAPMSSCGLSSVRMAPADPVTPGTALHFSGKRDTDTNCRKEMTCYGHGDTARIQCDF